MGAPMAATRVGEEAEAAMLTDGLLVVVGIAQPTTLAGMVTITEVGDVLAHALGPQADITDPVVATDEIATTTKEISQEIRADRGKKNAEGVEAPRVVRVVGMGRLLSQRTSVTSVLFLFSNLQHV